MNALLRLFLPLAALAVSAGCVSDVNMVTRAQPEGSTATIPDKRVAFDESLRDDLRIVGVSETVVSGNLRKVQFTLASARSRTLSIGYRVEWFDRDGMAAATLQGWQYAQLLGHETITLSSVSPSPQAVDFALKLIEGR
jgi:uncharacterized protein YcfL